MWNKLKHLKSFEITDEKEWCHKKYQHFRPNPSPTLPVFILYGFFEKWVLYICYSWYFSIDSIINKVADINL